jgi:heavy metal sensor kinase
MKTNTSAPYAAQAINWWIPIKPKSLRVRLALLAALLLCFIQLVLSAAFYTFTSSWLLNQIDQNLLTTATQVAASIQGDNEPLENDDLEFEFVGDSEVTTAFLQEQHFFIRAIELNTGEILNSNATYDLNVTTQALNGDAGYETLALSAENNLLIRVYTLPLVDSPPYALQVGQSLDTVHQTQAQILRLLTVMVIATGVLALGSGWFLAHRALLPVSAITRTAREIGGKDLSQRIVMNLPDDELGQLAQTFNGMLDRIEAAFQRQRQFTADAAHELRTPLSIMQTGLDVVLSQSRSADEYHSTLENIHEEVLRLSQLTTHLLMLARVDAHTLTIEPHPIDLSLLLNTVTEQISIAAEQKQITLHCDIPAHMIIHADEDRLIQLTLNLLENAVKYTPIGGSITVKLSQSNHQVCFSIADTGMGIAPQHLTHIFDRFYRIDRARNRQQGGVGLGLAIAQQIVQLHHGSIHVVSQVGSGSEFTVTLPIS